MKKEISIWFVLLLVGLSGGLIVWKYFLQKPTANPEGSTIPRRIQYSFTIENSSNKLLEKVRLWVFAPVKKNSHQQCGNITASYPFETQVDDQGNQVLGLVIDKIPPYGSRIITISAEVEIVHSPETFEGNIAKELLEAGENIQSDHPEIEMKAKALKAKNPVQTARNIFQWVSETVQYERHSGASRGALYAIRKLKGDCTEYADLYAALCRAAGIPARSMGGYLCPQDMVLKALDYHNWAEIFLDGEWYIADPQRKVLQSTHSEYIATRIIGPAPNRPVPNFDKFFAPDPILKVSMNQ